MQHWGGIIDSNWIEPGRYYGQDIGHYEHDVGSSAASARGLMHYNNLPAFELNGGNGILSKYGGYDNFIHNRNFDQDKMFNLSIIGLITQCLTTIRLERLEGVQSTAGSLMKSAVESLIAFYGRDLMTLVVRDIGETTAEFDIIARKNQGTACLATLKRILNSERGGETFPDLDFHLVRDSLYALQVLHDHGLIAQTEVKGFFWEAPGIIKSVGEYFVHIYGEQYPNFSRFENFIPDMDFLKSNSQTLTQHWWLENSKQDDLEDVLGYLLDLQHKSTNNSVEESSTQSLFK
ncbi:uncharacterized protein PGTG_10070 [Puccinia graminis f. sp. tritici CRL 75-36-700-3]|uniref:Uncharacterized protein n=1 Tax=Puccinia graminis f. sp. tritici (strain CRL 75-36-700-3 / race SCCL) TaxID=418459 RepID=E3KJ75_PUCGT|nr:uncharacterized protein PGTG_10070 [Puccinia graminis f. sp. tritici CRL 75-36-700-3]EFP84350.2 hypothetical protein PGTG_10070 [Puccinia graminis f. sp. tritici CRL 75-36-700-3]